MPVESHVSNFRHSDSVPVTHQHTSPDDCDDGKVSNVCTMLSVCSTSRKYFDHVAHTLWQHSVFDSNINSSPRTWGNDPGGYEVLKALCSVTED